MTIPLTATHCESLSKPTNVAKHIYTRLEILYESILFSTLYVHSTTVLRAGLEVTTLSLLDIFARL